jgi:hypothetical protein
MHHGRGVVPVPWHVVANSFLNIKFRAKGREEQQEPRTAIWIEEYHKRSSPTRCGKGPDGQRPRDSADHQ